MLTYTGAGQSSGAAEPAPPAAHVEHTGQKMRGGWFQKCLQLVKLVQRRSWDQVRDLSEEYAQHPSMSRLVWR